MASLVGKGVAVYAVDDDAAERGIERTDLVEGVKPISLGRLPGLLGRFPAPLWLLENVHRTLRCDHISFVRTVHIVDAFQAKPEYLW